MSTASGTDDFAALLRSLKTRSGLSYGALAKRLHMSTSTLHRYCNGDAVPTDYAPVERLARVCGAKPEELVELHRQWILADAARGRRGVEGDAPVPPPVAAPAGEAKPEPEAEDAPVAAPAPVPEPAPAPAPDPAPEPPTPEPTPTCRPTRSTRPSRPKLRWALAGTAALALAVPVVVSGVTSSGEGSSGVARAKMPDHRPDSGGRGAVPDGGPSGTPSPSASVSAGPTGKPKQDSAPASADPSSAGTGAATGAGTDGSARRSGTPLTVDVRTNNWDDPCDRWYMLDKPPTEVPPPPTGVSARGWANALGGVPGGHLRVSLAVQGTGDEAVVLHSLNVRTTTRTAAMGGSAYSMGDGCGGGLTPASFDVGLDAAQPLMRPVAGEQGDRKIPATDFPFKVSASDPQALYVDAHTEANDVSWYLELEWSSGGRRGTLRLDDHGRPFRTSAMKGRPAYGYRYDTNVWEPIEN
ncbi:helix-turn-helix domain-containing protein [Streptomyces sp. NPDC017056]|uniref:helix-turn-helix domain-containing protein n=1 Tax=Streptomyces sp. NPDC017056 TaxID=3364973 RepID=UPI00379A8023